MNGASPLNNPTPRLRVAAVVGLSVLVVGCVLLGWYADWSWFPLPTMPAGALTPFQPADDGPRLPGAYAHDTGHYAGLAVPLPPVTPPLPPVTPLPSFSLPTVPATTPPTSATGTGTAQAVVPQARSAQAPSQTKEGVKKPKWEYLAKAEAGAPEGRGSQDALPGVVREAQGRQEQTHGVGGAQALIQPARWAIPAEPLKTLYRSMLLPGRLLDNIHSDIPGSTIRIELPIPVYDKFDHSHIILDKGSIIIAKQAGKTDFGQRRLPLHLEQIELVSGEIVSLKATVGDEHGASGVPGKVNAHTGKLLLATAINAVLNIGLSSAAGTPNGFYQNPAQSAINEAGQSAAKDINTIVSHQLKVPPTIEVKAGQIVSISLEENIQFSKKAVVVP